MLFPSFTFTVPVRHLLIRRLVPQNSVTTLHALFRSQRLGSSPPFNKRSCKTPKPIFLATRKTWEKSWVRPHACRKEACARRHLAVLVSLCILYILSCTHGTLMEALPVSQLFAHLFKTYHNRNMQKQIATKRNNDQIFLKSPKALLSGDKGPLVFPNTNHLNQRESRHFRFPGRGPKFR